MRYPRIGYARLSDDLLALAGLDGVVRRVAFATPEAADAAMVAGRAEADWVAVASGLMPRGAVLVTRGVPREPHELIDETAQATDGVQSGEEIAVEAAVREAAAATIMITKRSAAAAVEARPDELRRYDLLLGELARSGPSARAFSESAARPGP